MCVVCGCGGDGATLEGGAALGKAVTQGGPHAHDHSHAHPHGHADDHAHGHGHDHGHDGGHAHAHDHGHGHAHGPHDHHHIGHTHAGHDHAGHDPAGQGWSHAPGVAPSRRVAIERDILAENNEFAAANRRRFVARRALALNLVSSPGSGKTTLLVRTIQALRDRLPVVVIEGDQQTSADADRIRAAGAPAVQINTGKGCHLDAHMVGHALDRVGVPEGGVVFIENVGNLVCPAAFDLGERAKVAVLSVTEGEDKPLKYPDLFAAAGLVLVNKLDLAPHVDADLDAIAANARRVNPGVTVLPVSARTGEGFDAWLDWLLARRAEAGAETDAGAGAG